MIKGLWSVFILFAAVFLATVAASVNGLPEEVSGYLSWTRANSQKSFAQSAHPVAKDIYYNEAAAASVQSGSFPHADGSILVKEVLNPDSLQVQMLPSMRKVAGFNPEGGDWQYAMFQRSDDGSFTGEWMSVADAAMCMSCHQAAADKDFTFLSYLD